MESINTQKGLAKKTMRLPMSAAGLLDDLDKPDRGSQPFPVALVGGQRGFSQQ